MAGASGDFTIPDDTGSATDLNTLFGVAQGVGGAPVILRGAGLTGQAKRNLRQAGEDVSGIPTSEMTATSIQGALQGFYGMDPQALTDLQQRLYKGGFYATAYYGGKTPQVPQFGVADEDSFQAFKTAVVRAARSQRPLVDLLDEAVTAAGGNAAQSTRAPFAPQLTSPTDLRVVGEQVFQQQAGQKPDSGWLDHFVAAFHSAELAAQQGAYDTQLTGGASTSAPNASALAKQMTQQEAPGLVGTHAVADEYGNFQHILKGPGG